MLKRIFSLLSTADPAEAPDRVPLATAVLLLEIAHADGEVSAEEKSLLRDLLEERFSLEPDTRRELLQLADETRRKSVDLHQFTAQINRNFTPAEKEEIIESFWRLAFADGRLDAHEEAMMRQLGHLIGLSQRQLIDAKLRARDGQSPT